MTNDKIAGTSEMQEMLAKMTPLASPDKLPTNFTENLERIWEAFEIGRDYERLTNEFLKQKEEENDN